MDVQAVRSGHAAEGDAVLAPPLSRRDHLDGAQWAPASLVVFGAYGMPASRSLGKLLEQLREAHAGSLCVGWRHFPDLSMRAGTGADRVVADVQSALASGVTSASTLFINGTQAHIA